LFKKRTENDNVELPVQLMILSVLLVHSLSRLFRVLKLSLGVAVMTHWAILLLIVVFWLCIYYDDRKRLLDASVWPDSLLIYEWFFKSQQSSVADQSKRQCLDVNAISRHDTAAAAQANMDSTNLVAEPINADSEVNVNTDLNDETTIVVNIDGNTISNNCVDDSSC